MDGVTLTGALLASMGITVLIVWPTGGPGAWVREKLIRPITPQALQGALDCYICFSFWSGLCVGACLACILQTYWPLALCLMTPAIFWFVLVALHNGADNT